MAQDTVVTHQFSHFETPISFFQLSNGLRVFSVQIASQKAVQVSIVSPYGFMNDGRHFGAANLLRGLIFPDNFAPLDYAYDYYEMVTQVGPYSVDLKFKGFLDNLSGLLNRLWRMIFSFSLRSEQLLVAKESARRDLAKDPITAYPYLAWLHSQIYPGRRNLMVSGRGTKESIAAFNQELIDKYYRIAYAIDSLCLIVVSALPHDQILGIVEKSLEGMDTFDFSCNELKSKRAINPKFVNAEATDASPFPGYIVYFGTVHHGLPGYLLALAMEMLTSRPGFLEGNHPEFKAIKAVGFSWPIARIDVNLVGDSSADGKSVALLFEKIEKLASRRYPMDLFRATHEVETNKLRRRIVENSGQFWLDYLRDQWLLHPDGRLPKVDPLRSIEAATPKKLGDVVEKYLNPMKSGRIKLQAGAGPIMLIEF